MKSQSLVNLKCVYLYLFQDVQLYQDGQVVHLKYGIKQPDKEIHSMTKLFDLCECTIFPADDVMMWWAGTNDKWYIDEHTSTLINCIIITQEVTSRT